MKVKVNSSFYQYFNEFEMTSNLDAVCSSFSMQGLYNPSNSMHRVLYKPLNYPLIEFFDDDDNLFFTGTIVSANLKGGPVPQLCPLSGYSLGGVLEDCTIPYQAYPLQSANRSLKEIAERLLGYFKLKLVVYPNVAADCDKIYTKDVASPSDNVKDYLAKLAAQRNVVLSHDVNGNVILFRPDTAARPAGWFDNSNITGLPELRVNGQAIHSSVGSIRQPGKRSVAESTSANATTLLTNNMVKAYRPAVHILSTGTETDTDDGAKNAFAAELKNIQITFEIPYWHKLTPGDVISLTAPELMISKDARLMVLNTQRTQSGERKTMTITAVLPETFTGVQPVDIFDAI